MKKTDFQIEKMRMAYIGYYTESDYAKMKKTSRQYIHRLTKDGKLEARINKDRIWVKYDDGQKAISIYGENPLEVFLKFGFVRRMKSVVVSDKVIAEIKLIDGISRVMIRFYNEFGDMMEIPTDLSKLEVIKHVEDSALEY